MIKYTALIILGVTIATCSYMSGQVSRQYDLTQYSADRHYQILADMADPLSVIDAEQKWRKEAGKHE